MKYNGEKKYLKSRHQILNQQESDICDRIYNLLRQNQYRDVYWTAVSVVHGWQQLSAEDSEYFRKMQILSKMTIERKVSVFRKHQNF